MFFDVNWLSKRISKVFTKLLWDKETPVSKEQLIEYVLKWFKVSIFINSSLYFHFLLFVLLFLIDRKDQFSKRFNHEKLLNSCVDVADATEVEQSHVVFDLASACGVLFRFDWANDVIDVFEIEIGIVESGH